MSPSDRQDAQQAADRAPLLDNQTQVSTYGTDPDEDQAAGEIRVDVSRTALACLIAQHLSNNLCNATNGFAIYVFLIEAFKDTLAPASLVGAAFTSCGIFFSGWIGGLVDKVPRLRFVRTTTTVQKLLQIVNCSLWLTLLVPLNEDASPAFHGRAPTRTIVAVYAALIGSLVNACVLHLANIGMDTAIERDWVTAIAQKDSQLLTKLNGIMRMIDLTAKLLAPLLVSVQTAAFGYPTAAVIIILQNVIALVIELSFVNIVYNRFPILRIDEERRRDMKLRFQVDGPQGDACSSTHVSATTSGAWTEFLSLPIFYAAMAQALTWLDTLSMDGVAISFFKAGQGWDDPFIAAIRALCVVTSTCGTVIMPLLERWIGVRATGAWGIWLEFAFVVAPIAVLFTTKAAMGTHGPLSESIIFFGGVALSRGAHIIFDLSEIKQLQQTLEPHPHRNRLTALQSSMINVYALLKYGLIFILSAPQQFKWTALISGGTIAVAGGSYMMFLGKSKRPGVSL